MEEEAALRRYCRTMIRAIQSRQQHQQSRQRRAGRGADTGEGRDRREPPLPPASHSHGPEPRPVPPQLLSVLRLKTVQEHMRRAAEVELHDPAVCSMCEQQQAFLALRSFIWRKKTQLQLPLLMARQNTHWSRRLSDCRNATFSPSPAIPHTGFGRNNLMKTGRSQQPGVAVATTKERGVGLATDEIRGHPDKNATGTDLERSHCTFPDR
ncbi:uncharacterized protein LOC115050235 [Echeneis naucrates]|uniref:uncharacterized protein LOC115050235 n=1 Tax=Echeneis naucrates TaxID=173247 RepID=UPI0011135824|nr:uncharacterized protein LOC115050235 [Echeneis naucrates]